MLIIEDREIEIAKKMLSKGMPVNAVVEYTDLDEALVRKLLTELNETV